MEPAPAAAPKTSPEPARTETTGSTASSEEEEIAKLGPAERAARRGEALPQAPAQQPLPPAPKKEDGPFPEGPFAPVVIENSLFQPTYLGSAWLESLHLQIDDRGDSLGFRWTNQTGMTLDFTLSNPFQIHVRDLAGTWEIDCMAAWRAGYVDYLLLGPADANRACIVSPQNPPLSKLRIGTDVCTLQSAGEVEVSIPGTPLVSRGRVSVLVGRD